MVTNNALEDKVGGHERYVRELAATLSRRGLGVTIVAKRWSSRSPEREERSDGVVIERYPVPSKHNPLYALLYPAQAARGVFARTNRRPSNTVIHAHMGLPALPLAFRRQQFLMTFHAPVWRELLSERQGTYVLPVGAQRTAVRALRSAERFVARRAAGTVVLSEFMRAELALLDRAAARRAVVVPGGIDGARFSPDPAFVAPAGDQPPLLFTARRLTPRTGVDELIRAMVPIAKLWPQARLKIAGTGAMQPDLMRLADELGVARSVEFLGQISDQQLVASYRCASLVVLPTRELEGFGLTTAEALACGTPVIGTPAGATPELLRTVDPALVTDDVSAEAIAAAVVKLLGDPVRLRHIRETARSRVVPAMTWDRVADRYLELYERLIWNTSPDKDSPRSPSPTGASLAHSVAAEDDADLRLAVRRGEGIDNDQRACATRLSVGLPVKESGHSGQNAIGSPRARMSTQTLPKLEAEPDVPQEAEVPRAASGRRWPRVLLAVIFAVVVAGATYGISTAVSPSYQSSAQLRVVVNEANGVSQDALQASNDLTAQLVQLLPTDAILTAPAKQLGMSLSALRSSVSVGSVAQQNLLQVTANAPSAAQARHRVATVAQHFIAFMASDARGQVGGYVHDLSTAISRTNASLVRLRTARSGLEVTLRNQLASNLKEEQSVLTALVRRQASAIPVIQQVQAAGLGSRVSPRPVLYAIVALLVAGLLAAQVVVLTERRRASALR
jgi:glycosyltransferase involved in cell wall biosynthesis/capsular polysaccharide biosynthesis protein